MRSDKSLLEWAEVRHYPQLVLGDQDVIRAGQRSWQSFVASQDTERKARAWQRIYQWNAKAA